MYIHVYTGSTEFSTAGKLQEGSQGPVEGRQQEGSQGPVEGRQQVDMVAVEDTVAWDTQPLLGHREEGSLSSLLL